MLGTVSVKTKVLNNKIRFVFQKQTSLCLCVIQTTWEKEYKNHRSPGGQLVPGFLRTVMNKMLQVKKKRNVKKSSKKLVHN